MNDPASELFIDTWWGTPERCRCMSGRMMDQGSHRERGKIWKSSRTAQNPAEDPISHFKRIEGRAGIVEEPPLIWRCPVRPAPRWNRPLHRRWWRR